LPLLTQLAATRLAMNMIGAGITHLKLKENANLILNIILFVLTAFVAYGRFVAVPL